MSLTDGKNILVGGDLAFFAGLFSLPPTFANVSIS